jgi:hypothetical protein
MQWQRGGPIAAPTFELAARPPKRIHTMAYISSTDLPIGGALRGGRKGAFARALDRLMEARMREAQRTVNGYLLTLDDQTLAELGHDRATLVKHGATARTPL